MKNHTIYSPNDSFSIEVYNLEMEDEPDTTATTNFYKEGWTALVLGRGLNTTTAFLDAIDNILDGDLRPPMEVMDNLWAAATWDPSPYVGQHICVVKWRTP